MCLIKKRSEGQRMNINNSMGGIVGTKKKLSTILSGNNKTVMGVKMIAVRLAIWTFFLIIKYPRSQRIPHIITRSGLTIKAEPNPVESPRPPLNFKNILKLCPKTTEVIASIVAMES